MKEIESNLRSLKKMEKQSATEQEERRLEQMMVDKAYKAARARRLRYKTILLCFERSACKISNYQLRWHSQKEIVTNLILLQVSYNLETTTIFRSGN